MTTDSRFLEIEKNVAKHYLLGVPVSAFGQNVKRLRLAKQPKLHAKELAARMGTDPSVISRWEQGKGGLPETPTLIRLAKELGATFDDLLAGVDTAYDAIRHREHKSEARTRDESAHAKKPFAVTPSVTPYAVQEGSNATAGGLSNVDTTAPDRLPSPESPRDVEVHADIDTLKHLFALAARLDKSANDVRVVADALRTAVQPGTPGNERPDHVRGGRNVRRTGTRARRS